MCNCFTETVVITSDDKWHPSQSWSQHHFFDMSCSVTNKHELWIWFTLPYVMMKALLRLAAVWDKKQTGDLRGDTVQFIALGSVLVLMTINGNIYRPLIQTATCPLPWYRSKHIAENSQWISQLPNSLTGLLTKKEAVRFREVVNTCTERRVENRIQRMVWILSHVLRIMLCESIGSSLYVLVHIVGPLAATGIILNYLFSKRPMQCIEKLM